ncbi:MAG: hypothetical protein H7338_07535 [Candidatus Sericytochromatia bacterium]|nr:hypothetical protein [Candidatus Sericytochromatia bacterium]
MQRVLTLSVLTATMLLVGCGRTLQTPPPLVPINGAPVSPGYSPGYATTPGYSDPNAYPGYSDPNAYPSGNQYDPNSGGSMHVPLVAKIDSKKNGTVLGLGSFTVTVSVSNPASTEQTGRLRVSILDKGESLRDFTEQITVPAGQTITRTYTDKRWAADNASVSVSPLPTNAPYATPARSASQGYGSTDQYGNGSTGGNYGSTGGSYTGYPASGNGYPSTDGSYSSGYPASNGGYPATGNTYGTNQNTKR